MYEKLKKEMFHLAGAGIEVEGLEDACKMLSALQVADKPTFFYRNFMQFQCISICHPYWELVCDVSKLCEQNFTIPHHSAQPEAQPKASLRLSPPEGLMATVAKLAARSGEDLSPTPVTPVNLTRLQDVKDVKDGADTLLPKKAQLGNLLQFGLSGTCLFSIPSQIGKEPVRCGSRLLIWTLFYLFYLKILKPPWSFTQVIKMKAMKCLPE